jgi:hypothetical protein
LQRLPDSSHIAMSEDAEASGEERVALAVARHELDFQELNDRLRGG